MRARSKNKYDIKTLFVVTGGMGKQPLIANLISKIVDRGDINVGHIEKSKMIYLSFACLLFGDKLDK